MNFPRILPLSIYVVHYSTCLGIHASHRVRQNHEFHMNRKQVTTQAIREEFKAELIRTLFFFLLQKVFLLKYIK